MRINVVRAGALHASDMAALLNEVIAQGGTTAITEPVAPAVMQDLMARGQGRSAWHVAEDAQGRVMGFQWIEPSEALPPEAADIATFARIGHTGLGIGSALFEETKRAALQFGYAWISANIRADNAGGLAYYQSRGFEDYGRIPNYRLGDGQVVDKVLKRYDLR